MTNPRELSPRAKAVAVGVAALVLAGAGAGVGMATTASGDPMGAPSGASMSMAPPGKHAATGARSAGPAVDPARAAWSHKYGQDRSTMPMLAPVGSATAQQRAAATQLLLQTEAATAKYRDPAAAKAAGYDLSASLARHERKAPRTADLMKRIDAGTGSSAGKMVMLHVGNKARHRDGKLLDPNAPETLMYAYQGNGKWTLIGVMYIANESYPQAPPDPGGPITRWHYHDKSGARGLMMHIFFVPGNDLAHAYATEMS